MRIAIATVLSLTITTLAFGQWDQIQRLPNLSQDSDHGGSPLYQGGGNVVFAANGDILVFYTENGAFTNPQTGDGTPAKVKMARSTDGGATWVEPVVILQANPNGVQNLGPALAAVNPTSGRITLVFFNLDGHSPSFQLEDQTWHSDDNGETWTRAGALSDFAQGEARLAYSPNGLLIYSYGTYDPSNALKFRTSDDDGATWSAEGEIATFGDNGSCDHTLTAFSDTEWLVYWSECYFGAGGTTSLTELRTSDGGTTWSDPEEFMTRGSGYYSGENLVFASDSTLWLTYTDDQKIYYRSSTDDGITWTDPEQWTFGDKEGSPECADASGSLGKLSQTGMTPLCVFVAQGRADDEALVELFLGQPGVSQDPLLTVGTEDVRNGIPGSFTLSQNYPNPFNPTTTIPFELEHPQHIEVTLHDALGRQIGILASGILSAGQHDVTIDASELPSGMYIYRLKTDDGVASRLMTVMK